MFKSMTQTYVRPACVDRRQVERINVMRIVRHGTYLVQLTLLPRLFPVNCYLVREDDGFTLIDTTLSFRAKAIYAAAQQLGAPIKRIALTHAHTDHVGGLDALHALVHSAEVLIGARDARLLAGDMRLDPAEPQAKLRGGYERCTTSPTRTLL